MPDSPSLLPYTPLHESLYPKKNNKKQFRILKLEILKEDTDGIRVRRKMNNLFIKKIKHKKRSKKSNERRTGEDFSKEIFVSVIASSLFFSSRKKHSGETKRSYPVRVT